ncbi:hypothetical protein VC82_904 [Flagellimonas lutaonensis]|uniref:Uncharacterized protein n=1 Tax=Flagellimonas lutaonensis TaxID=516051 RepID=A0A0D5YRM8_9FLAO|nr:hypothetical protein VC82_904 [Allomuricauda lutaonensis]
MKRLLLSFFLVTSCLYAVLGQKNVRQDSISEVWENIHLHINKTTFTKGERLWFAAYVQNQKAKIPSFSTTNLRPGGYGE